MKKVFILMLLSCSFAISAWGDAIASITFSDGRASQSPADFAALRTALSTLPVDGTVATVTLLQDIVATPGANKEVLKFPANTNSIFNLNGKGISLKREIYNETDFMGITTNDIDDYAVIANEGTLRIVSEGNSIVQMPVTVKYSMWDGTVGSATTICNDGTLVIDGGIFIGPWNRTGTGASLKLPVIWAKSSKSHITINGGTFVCYEEKSDHALGPILGPIAGGGTWVIKGGIFSTSEELFNTRKASTDHKSTKDYYLTATTGKALPSGYKAIEVPYTNANIPGYTTDRENHIRDNDADGNADYYMAPKKVCMVVADDDNKDNFLQVGDDVTITVNEGEALRVGTGGIAFGTNSKIIVEPGASLLSEGNIITSTSANIELTMDARNNKYSTLALKYDGNIPAKHPEATITLKSVANYDGVSTYKWQRFASPTYLIEGSDAIKVSDFASDHADPAYKTAVYNFDYEANDWHKLGASEYLKPFVGYQMTVNADVEPDYTFTCELVGKGNPIIDAYQGWNFLANSYTAPIDVKAMLTDFIGRDEDDAMSAAVWVQNTPGSLDWTSVSFANVVRNKIPAMLQKLNPMQAFLVNRLAVGGDFTLDYAAYVSEQYWSTSGSAPARRAPKAYDDLTYATIVVTASDNTQETLELYLSKDFSDAFDNGFDVQKMKNVQRFNFYAVNTEDIWGSVASDNLDNTSITIETKDATEYTISFEDVTLEGYQIIDLKNNTKTDIMEGKQYVFTAAANTLDEGRFAVIMKSEVDPTTAIENTETNNRIHNGIYTLTGQYMGNNINVLPAGVYVVNGKKVVK